MKNHLMGAHWVQERSRSIPCAREKCDATRWKTCTAERVIIAFENVEQGACLPQFGS